jgi:succinate-semialdehyde dehydrogenase
VEKVATFAKPVGVVAALVPTTNPVSTTVSNGMSILKCRNAMIVSPHPRTKNVTKHGVDLMNAELAKLGAPENLIQIIETPGMEFTSELMKKADVVVATGGFSMVKSAYSSGRPAFGVGQGNVQVIVAPDYTDYDKLAAQVVNSRSYDNGMPCTGEQAIHLPKEAVADVLAAFEKKGAYVLPDEYAAKLTGILFKENGATDPAHVGMLPCKLAELMGLEIPESTTLLLFASRGMTRENLLRKEKLCPVVQYFPYDTFEEGIANAKSNLLWEGAGHSSVVYTNDTARAEYAGFQLPVSRLLVNQPGGAASGGNFINGLNPTMSLGCGSWGNNSISENLTYKHLMNTTRLAYYHDPTIPSPEEVWAE